MNKVFDFLQDNWLPISAVIEAGLRLIPTTKNLSIIDNVFKVVSFLIKNRRKPSPADTLPNGDEKVNAVIVDRFKHIIPVILIACFAFSTIAPQGAFAQTNVSGKSVRFFNADSATVRAEVATLDATYNNVGSLYYNDEATPGKFRIYYDHAWHDLIQGSGGGGNTIYTGNGSLAGNRIVDGDQNTLSFNDLPLLSIKTDLAGVDTVALVMDSQQGIFRSSVGDYFLQSDPFSYLEIYTSEVSLVNSDGGANSSELEMIGGDFNTTASGNTTIQSGSQISLTSTNNNVNVNAFNNVSIITGDGIVNPVVYLDVDGSGPFGSANSVIISTGDWSGSTTDYGYFAVYYNGAEIMTSDALGSVFANVTAIEGVSGMQASDSVYLQGENLVSLIAPSGGISMRLTDALTVNGDPGTANYVLTSSGTGASPQWLPAAGGDNIYTADGTLTGTRVLTGNANDLTFTGLNTFNVESDAGITYSTDGNTIIESLGSTFIREPSTFSYIQLDPNGTVNVQLGTSGFTNSEFFISNGSQESPTANGLLRINKGNNAAENDTINWIYQGFAIVDGGDGANGYGTGIKFAAENTGGGGNEQIGALAFTYKDATSNSEDSRAVIKLLENSLSYDAFEIWSDGTNTHVKITGGLPTSCTGLGTGELADISGVLNICP